MAALDLECGGRSSAEDGGAASEQEEEDGVVYFSDAEEVCCSSEILEDEDLGRDCRICHLSLVSCSPSSELAIELGCSCKDDLAAAHKHCAETWFKIKGNKICEICNSIASNVTGPTDTEAAQQANEVDVTTSNTTYAPAMTSGATETRNCLNGHRLLNFLLACMVFAFVISWLFHFNLPS